MDWIKAYYKSIRIGGCLIILAGSISCSNTEASFSSPEANRLVSEANTSTSENFETPVTFQEAIDIAEAAVDGKVYVIEREMENHQPVIEIELGNKEVVVDAETGDILLIDHLLEKDDPEDTESVATALKLQQFPIIPIQDALEVAETFSGEKAHTVALENEEGNLVYEIVIGLDEIYVDAGNGEILFTETASRSDNDNDQPRSSIQVPFSDEDDD